MRYSHMHSLVRLAIVVLLDISGSMTLAGFEVPRDRDAMPGRAYGDVRAKDRVVFTDRARNSNMRGKVFDFWVHFVKLWSCKYFKSDVLLVVANRIVVLAG